MKHTIAFIIPAYNEEATIENVIKDVRKHAKKEKLNFEVIVVDDGSSDNTAKIAKNANATVVQHVLNTGSGGATATGLSYAQQNGFTIAATLDADGQHTAQDTIKGVKQIGISKADLLIGSRLIDTTGMSKVKIIGNKGLSIITNVLFGVYVTDSQSGLRIYSQKALNTIKWKTNGFEFCSEMLWRAKQNNLIIKEYPIAAVYTEYSKAKGQNNWNAFIIVKSLFERRIMELFGE